MNFKNLITTLFLGFAGCAHLSGATMPRAAITYSCNLEHRMCELVDAAATNVAARGYPTSRVESNADLTFVASRYYGRSVFAGHKQVLMSGGVGLVSPELLPHVPLMEREHGMVGVVIIRGGLVRDHEIVEAFENMLLVGRRQ